MCESRFEKMCSQRKKKRRKEKEINKYSLFIGESVFIEFGSEYPVSESHSSDFCYCQFHSFILSLS